MIVATLKRNGMLGGASGSLEGEEWVRQEDGSEILMGRVDGTGQMKAYTNTQGEPISRAAAPVSPDEYQRYVKEEDAAGREPLSRLDYAREKKGNGFSVTTADGTTVQMGGARLTEGQSKDLVYATRAVGALEILNENGDALTSRLDRLADMDPTGFARETQSESFQLAKQAGDEFLQAILRKDTGAAITVQEQELYGTTYLPRPGDSPALLKQKRESRDRAVIALEAGMSSEQILRLEMASEKDRENRANPSSKTSRHDSQARAPETKFSTMSIEDLNMLDVGSLSIEEVDAAEARYKELRGGQNER